MRVNSVLISGLSLASAVLAERHLKGIVLDASDEIDNDVWAGVSATDSPGNVLWTGGIFTVPNVSPGVNGGNSGGIIMVGIDGGTCKNASLEAGVVFTVSPNNEPSYRAGWSWTPSSGLFSESDISIFPGDRMNVEVAAHSGTSGLVKIRNVTKNQTATQHLQSNYSLCMQDAVWAVSRYGTNLSLANFGEMKISGAVATGTQGQNYIPQDPIHKITTWEILDWNNASKRLTSVEIDAESEGQFSVTYVG